MNKKYDDAFQSCFSKYEKIFSGRINDQLPFGYLEIASDFLRSMEEYGFVKSYDVSNGVKVSWMPMEDIRKKYPTVRGENPNVNIMDGVNGAFDLFCKRCDEVLRPIPSDSFDKLGYRQACRDFLEFAKMSNLIEDYVLAPNRKVSMPDPKIYLSKAQIDKLENKQASRDLSIR